MGYIHFTTFFDDSELLLHETFLEFILHLQNYGVHKNMNLIILKNQSKELWARDLITPKNSSQTVKSSLRLDLS